MTDGTTHFYGDGHDHGEPPVATEAEEPILEAAEGQSGETLGTKVIHTIWTTTRRPAYLKRSLAEWQKLHPEWEMKHWDEEAINGFPLINERVYAQAQDYVDDAYHAGQLRSDLVRYEIMLQYGGLYVDVGMRALKPIDPLLEGVITGAGWETDNAWVGNSLLYAATEGQGIWGEIINGIPENLARRASDWRPNRLTGPQYVTSYLTNGANVTLWPSKLIYPVRWDKLENLDREFPEAYTKCYWPNMHRRLGLKVPL